MNAFLYILATSVLVVVSGCTTYPELGGKSIYDIVRTLPDPQAPPLSTLDAKKASAEQMLKQNVITLAGLSAQGSPVLTKILLKEGRTITYWASSTCSAGYLPITARVDEEGNVEVFVRTNAKNSDGKHVLGCPNFTYTINPENKAVWVYDYLDGQKIGPFKRKFLSIE